MTCVRGASALDDWLARHPGAAGFVIWEPVLSRDRAPTTRVAHAHNYWDARRTRSTALQASGWDPACLQSGSSDEAVVWDVVFDFPPGADAPAACGRTVLDELPKLTGG